jgi:excisionase family DNA binding protein
MDEAIVGWANKIPVDQIARVVAYLTARLLSESRPGPAAGGNHLTSEAEHLLTARELAARLNLPESWVRSEQRAGRLPYLRLGKYIRFNWSEVEQALGQRG